MRSLKRCLNPIFVIIAAAAVLSQSLTVTSVVVPKPNCYALDNSSRLLDFSDWIGVPFAHEGKDSDWVIRFCKDVESRSQTGYVDFGRYDNYNYFVAGSGHVYLVQANKVAYAMSLMNPLAESLLTWPFHVRNQAHGYLRALLLDFIHDHGKFWVLKNLTVILVTLYLTAIASQSNLVRKPVVKIFPENGLEVKISGSGQMEAAYYFISLDFASRLEMCKGLNSPYEVKISIPVEGYEPIEFVLTKMCEYTQNQEEGATRGWAIFGIILHINGVVDTILLCRVYLKDTNGRQHGIDALPGMTILSACLETVSGAGHGYSRVEDVNTGSASEVSWERPSSAAQGTWKLSESKYGSV
ncbi:hypothetical protein F3Y22_tig00110330pilonHSYRG00083 [Hibiscus syriacus]|uniref:Uncharacterized protein n=1 Tax=Hibiscus syriacus TaxID=106335 RepID=A0A6A3AXU7_HIBSY|nr:hypothetical protein F3Y22_tig00110330pilonHSYRG00083 [Hibiscus syriacus]